MAIELKDLAPLLVKKERAGGAIRPEVITEVLRGGKAANDRRKQLVQVIANHPVLSDRDVIFRNHAERYTVALKKIHSFAHLLRDGDYTDPNDQQVLYDAIGERLPDHIHRIMFIPTLTNQGDDEQRDKWLPLARSYRIFGAYAQTELGHGSNVQGLETTALFDKATQEFIINSPTLTSRKFWPGGLGKTANHAVVHARLQIDGRDFGVQAFIVQIRSLIDHQPVPGVEVGDVGPKVGWDSIDNGYCVFHNVRVPRENMLARYAKVLADGTFVRAKSDKMVYLTMVQGRAEVLGELAAFIGAAATITTRFSAARVQGSRPGSFEEWQVLDYQNQQHALFPCIALSYATVFAHRAMVSRLDATLEALKVGSSQFDSRIVALHAISSGMKAWFGEQTSNGIERCRRLCGGHGFSNTSNLAHLLSEMALVNTGEGTFDVLTLQHGQFLLKMVGRASNASSASTPSDSSSATIDDSIRFLLDAAKYLNPELRFSAQTLDDLDNLETLVEVMRVRSTRAIYLLVEEMRSARGDANSCKVIASRASVAHTELLVLESFARGVTSLPAHSPEREAVAQLCALLGVWMILRSLGEFRQHNYLSSAQAALARQQELKLLAKIRPNAVLLTDAWDFADFELNSTIGRYDGDIYRALVRRVADEPLNGTQVVRGYEAYLKPLTCNGKL